ncbi:MAG TPA: hypothetical protein VK149_05170 [Sideroxyarcus sp.]|nr:hypothetical protein [Sideroxyarcus sp.]
MPLCYLQTLVGIAGDNANTIVFPVPDNFMSWTSRQEALNGLNVRLG